ncbi:MAG: DUF2203 domain-containing protein [Planctomycetota bacterium]
MQKLVVVTEQCHDSRKNQRDCRTDQQSIRKTFTLSEANLSLVLVRKVVADITRRYAVLLDLRAQRYDLSRLKDVDDQLDQLNERIEQTIEELNHLHDELHEIGCVLKDWTTGLVDFPGIRAGQPICLCWRLDEPNVTHWHEPHAGFAGRQPIDADCL